MDDAYTIGITLALENGVSEGLAIIRRDLEALDVAISHTVGGLAELRRASDAAVASAGMDFARLAAEGQRLLGRLPSVTTAAAVRQLPEADNRADEAAPMPSGEAAAPKAVRLIASASAPLREWAPLEVAAGLQHPAVPVAPVATSPAPYSAGISAPAAPAASPAASAAAAPHLAPVARETPSRVHVEPPPVNAVAVVPLPAPMPAASVTRTVPIPVSVPPVVSVAPTPAASVARTVPIPSSVPPAAGVAPIAERPVAAPAAAAPPPIPLTVADLSTLARRTVPDSVPLSRPAPPQLTPLAASAAPEPMPGPIQPASAFGRAEVRERVSSATFGWRTSDRPADTADSAVPVQSIAPPRVPSWAYRPEPLVPAESMPGAGREPEQHRQTAFRAEGPVYLDSHMVGRWMCDHLAREAGRAPAGPTGFDSRAGMIWPGAPIQT